MRVVIVGGTGHISGSLVNSLITLGHEVTCFHRTQCDELPDGVKQILGDRQNREDFEAKMQDGSFDAAIDMIAFNAEDTASSLRAFKGVQHFIHCSTVCTYGLPQDRFPIDEKTACNPVSDYGKNKLAADNLCLNAFKQSGVPVTIVKPSTTYGPKMGLLRQIAWDFTWINRIREGKPIIHCADGMALHQFMYVDDCAHAIALLLGRSESFGETYNIVPDRCWSWREQAETAMQVIGNTVPLISASYQQLKGANIEGFGICDDIFRHHTYYSSAKLRALIPGFKEQFDLSAGMKATIDGMEARGKLPPASDNTWEDDLIMAIS